VVNWSTSQAHRVLLVKNLVNQLTACDDAPKIVSMLLPSVSPRVNPPILEIERLAKSFPGVAALVDVSLSVFPGEVHALLGENGAGKSTLLKILAGAQHQDSGLISFDGRQLGRESPFQRQQLGIVTVYQEFNLMPNLSVAENILVGREPTKFRFVNWKAMYRQAKDVAARLELTVDPRTTVATLSVAEQQLVEIAKAINLKAKLIILDEPTAALSNREVTRLHKLVIELKREGIAFIYVTHRLDEIAAICDRFSVLRDGKLIGSGHARTTPTKDIISMMVGRNLDTFSRSTSHTASESVLRVVEFTQTKKSSRVSAVGLRGISLELRKGEILGLAGLVGAGRTELARAIFGADRIEKGKLYLNGKEVSISSPKDAIRLGIAMVPEDRKQQGLFLNQSIQHNLSLSNLPRLCRWKFFVDRRAEKRLTDRFRHLLQIRMPSPETPVRTLSGGNQQKIILARCLALSPKVLIVDEPTRGIDVRTKREVHDLLRQLASTGTAVLAISSELPELLSLCDRICTVKEGSITGDIAVEEASEEKLMTLMMLGPAEQHTHLSQ
jgi:inositol transport system ATP-binding protein